METYVEQQRVFADPLNWLDKESRQLALYVDQVVQRLFGDICISNGKDRGQIVGYEETGLSGRQIRSALGTQD